MGALPASTRSSIYGPKHSVDFVTRLGLTYNYDTNMPTMFSPQADGTLPGVRGQSVGRQGMTAKSFGAGARPRRVLHQLDTSMAAKRSLSTLKKDAEASADKGGHDLLKLLVGQTISRSKDVSLDEKGQSTQKLPERE